LPFHAINNLPRVESPVVAEYSVRVVPVAVAGLRQDDCPVHRPAGLASSTIRSRFELAAEILALRHQLAVLQRTAPKQPRLRPIDRLLWVLLERLAELAAGAAVRDPCDRGALASPCVRRLLAWNSRPRRVGRPALAPDLRALISQMGQANPLWGAPRIHGELQKLGIEALHHHYERRAA
jgi:hypothetical protein